jgi:hypothetical protein
MKRNRVWVGLGTAILVAPQGAAIAEKAARDQGGLVVAQSTPRLHGNGAEGEGRTHGTKAKSSRPAKAKAGGDGEGEGGAADAGLEPSIRFYRDIQLIRGHLLVGDELVKEGRWKEALPHFLHPSEEIYGRIGTDLKRYGVPPFATSLKALAQTVKAKNKEAYAGALSAVEERLAAADKAVRAPEANWPYFALETAVESLRSAAEEYEEAVERGTIANVVEYQDSRGFVWQAERLFASVADDLSTKDADSVASIRAAFGDLKAAWPTPMPPQKPAKDLSQVLGDISKIELQLGRLK